MVSSSNHSARKAVPIDGLRGVRVLLVEDAWQVGQSLKDLLQRMGATVAGPAATTDEADRLISDDVPHIALVDFHLRGHDLADRLIHRLNELGVIVVVISGYEVLPASTGSVAAFLRKPFTDEQLLAILYRFIA
jgi:DNA-binding NtrC family response regulator